MQELEQEHLEDTALAKHPLSQVLPFQLPGGLQLLVPVPGLAGDVLIVAELAGEGVLGPDRVDGVIVVGAHPPVQLVGKQTRQA